MNIRRIINRPVASHASDATPQVPTYLTLGPLVATFQLTLPPPLSRLTRNASGIGRGATKEAKAWREGNAVLVGASWGQRGALDFPVSVWIHLGLNSMRSDVANFEKATTDLLVHCGVLRDDSATWVRSNHQVYHPGVERGMVKVEVRRAV